MNSRQVSLFFLCLILIVSLINLSVYAPIYGEWTVSNEWTIGSEWTIGEAAGETKNFAGSIGQLFSIASSYATSRLMGFSGSIAQVWSILSGVDIPTWLWLSGQIIQVFTINGQVGIAGYYTLSGSIAQVFSIASTTTFTLVSYTFSGSIGVVTTILRTITGFPIPVVAPPLFSWPDWGSLLSGWVTAYFIYPVMIIGMIAIGLVVIHYRSEDKFDMILSSPDLIIWGAVGLVAVFVFYIVISTILGAF